MSAMFLKFFMTLLLLFSARVAAEIVEIAKMEQALPFIDKDTLVLFDIDNTIMETAQTLGSNQWFEHRVGWYKEQGLDPSVALERALHEWMAIQHITEVQLVESDTADFIRELQSKGVVLMGLTTRGLGLSTCTIHQLHRLSVDLSATAPSHEEMHFLNEGEGVLYRAGILFTSGTQKGDAVCGFFDRLAFSPKKILFINDKHSHLRAVEMVVEKRDIPFMGLRYSFLDDKVRTFRKEIADAQFAQFGRILSDSDAEFALAAGER